MRERSFGKTECFIIRGSTIDIIAQIQAPGCFKREKKPRHLNSSCHTVNYIFTSMRTKCIHFIASVRITSGFALSPNLQNLQHGVPETAILRRSKRAGERVD